MTKTNPAYIDIELADPRHRQVIAAALKAKDSEALADLKGNTHKPIRFVLQWFLHALMHHEHDESGYVVIYNFDVRRTIQRVASMREGDVVPDSYEVAIPMNTYDFLL